MSILNPVFLYFLIFAAFPVILFFIRKTNIEEIYLPTSKFIKDVMRKTKKKIDLKALLLMFLRILTIILIVVSAASFSVNSFSGKENHKSVLVIDNSISILSHYESIEKYKDELERQIDIIKKQENFEELYFVFYKNGFPVIDRGISDMEFYNGIFDIEEILRFIYSESSLSRNIIVFSDNQKINFKNIRDISNLKNIKFIDIRKHNKSNIYVKEIDIAKPAFSNQENLIGIVFYNNTNYSMPFKAGIYYDNVLVSQQEQIIEKYSEKKIFFNIKLNNSPFHDLYVNISGDETDWDNKYYFGINSIDNINILHTGKKLNFFLKNLFLSNINENPFSLSSLSKAKIQQSDIIIINNTDNIEDDLMSIEESIEQGKTILIFPDDNREKINVLNSRGILRANILEKTGGTRKIENKPGFDNISFFNIYFIKDYNIEDVIEYYDDRNPAVLKYFIGESRIYFFNRLLSDQSTDLVFSPYFVYEILNIIFFEKNYYNNIRQEIIPFRCTSSSNEKICLISPGVYNIEGERIYLNIPYEESSQEIFSEEITVFNNIQDSLKKVNIDNILLFMALIIMLAEFYLCEKWRR